MSWAVLACVLLVALTTVIHYEALRGLQRALPRLRIPSRSKLLVVMAVAFAAHLLEMAVYGLAMYGLIHWAGLGTLNGAPHTTLESCLYFSAETYTSLGYGDLTP
ncbi:MAG: ion transporter, partial [Burkholderiales bacterium PBB5]